VTLLVAAATNFVSYKDVSGDPAARVAAALDGAAAKQFRMMAYPNRSHGISEGRGTTLHLYTMFTRFFEETLLAPGGRPR
jgi:hypothetical protein